MYLASLINVVFSLSEKVQYLLNIKENEHDTTIDIHFESEISIRMLISMYTIKSIAVDIPPTIKNLIKELFNTKLFLYFFISSNPLKSQRNKCGKQNCYYFKYY